MPAGDGFRNYKKKNSQMKRKIQNADAKPTGGGGEI